MYDQSLTMKHLMFVTPFLWDEELSAIEYESKTVAWLLAIPISETERVYAEEKGYEALEDLFEKKQIDIFDLDRPIVL